ncbi:hypothetical protein PA5247_01515 [Pseudomonas aeruginosa]
MTLAYGEQARAGSLRNVEAGTFNREMYGAFDPLGTALSTLIDLQLSEGAKLNEQMEKRYDSMRTTFLLIGAAALVLIVAAAWFISLSIMRPLSDLRGVIRRVQDSSNLTLRADARGRDEVSDTARAFNMMLESQQALLRHLAETARKLTITSDEMSAISNQVSHVATSQGDQNRHGRHGGTPDEHGSPGRGAERPGRRSQRGIGEQRGAHRNRTRACEPRRHPGPVGHGRRGGSRHRHATQQDRGNQHRSGSHPEHRPANQPARPQCRDRSRTGGRGRTRVRGGRR